MNTKFIGLLLASISMFAVPSQVFAASNSQVKLDCTVSSKLVDSEPNNDTTSDSQLILQTSLKFKKSKINKKVGDKCSVKATTNEANCKITYKSSNKKVATITKKGVIKCKKTGSANITAKCNGVSTKCKLTVKKKSSGTSLSATKMSNIASSVGKQIDYAYSSSTVMCSAYSFAYAYYQVTGVRKSAGSFWSSAGCTWNGGTYYRYGSSSAMLSKIKSELDKNKACVGFLRTSTSTQHYVTFYGYTGSGTKLSDFKILDPWDAKLTTGANYGYNSIGYHVVTVNK